jgi:hypothetical protein
VWDPWARVSFRSWLILNIHKPCCQWMPSTKPAAAIVETKLYSYSGHSLNSASRVFAQTPYIHHII